MSTTDDITGRAKLKNIFSQGHAVTADSFAALIDSTVNEVDDKMARLTLGSTGDSICIAMGSIGTLLAFMQEMDQDKAEWVLRLDPNDQSLEFRLPDGGTSVLTLTKNGRVGIKTDAPQADLHVNGSIMADSLQLDGELKVQDLSVLGTLNVTTLNLNGVTYGPGNPISGTPSGGDGGDGNTGTTDSGDTNDMGDVTEGEDTGADDGAPDDTGTNENGNTNDEGAQFRQLSTVATGTGNSQTNPPLQVEQPTLGATPDTNAAASVTAKNGKVLANGNWHAIAQSVQLLQAYDVIAYVQAQDNCSLTSISAVNVLADPSQPTIQQAISYSGATNSQIEFQWNGLSIDGKTGAALYVRAGRYTPPGRSVFPPNTYIYYQIKDMLPAAWQSVGSK